MRFNLKKSLYGLGLLLSLALFAIISWNMLKNGEEKMTNEKLNFNLMGNTLEVDVEDNKLIIQICDDDILRVNYLPRGKKDTLTPVIDNIDFDYNGATIDTNTNPITIKTPKMMVKINKETGRISVYDADGSLLIKEQDIENPYNDGVKFNYDTQDQFYGIYATGAGSSAGTILRNDGGTAKAGSQGEGGAPFVWSTRGYGVLVDSVVGRFSISEKEIIFRANTKKDIEYFIMVGRPEEIFSSVAQISGRAPMFPKWSMGFHNTEWGIDQEELTNIVNTYREKNIPIDSYILDFDWKAWGEDNYGEFRWNDEKFPDGSSGKLKEAMDEKGIKMSGIMKPRLHVDTEQGRYATEKGFWWPDKKNYPDYFSKKLVNDLDFSIQECREWYFDHIKGAFDTGIIGWWNDEADEGFDSLQFLNMQRALYEGQRSYSSQRVWSINRNFLLGAQRYAYALWSGDIRTGFKSMADQREKMLSSINIGQMKWSMDTGGFSGPESTPENYTRWMQFSAFTPIFRVHGTENTQRQPWFFGEQAEKVSKDVMELRYKLIPYIYSYEWKTYSKGVGLVKPLIFDYPEDRKVVDCLDSWMFGDYLLVSPVVEEGQVEKEIYLPEGTWIDYFTGKRYSGNQTIKYPINAETWEDIPLFIKEGAIIPSQDFINYVGEKPVTNIYVDVFPSNNETSFLYYDDDGLSYNYEKGEYFIQTMKTKIEGDKVIFNISPKEGNYNPELQYYIVKIHSKGANNINLNDSILKEHSDIDSLLNSDEEGWIKTSDIYGEVNYIKVRGGESIKIILQ